MTRSKRKHLPRPLLAAIVMLTAAGTAWAMWDTEMRGPQTAWEQTDRTVDGIWGPATAHATGSMGPGGVRPVAGAARGAPTIRAGASAPHADRGACTGCHSVLSAGGAPVPGISSFAAMPHGYRGVCTNCHRISAGNGATAAGMGTGTTAARRQGTMPRPLAGW